MKWKTLIIFSIIFFTVLGAASAAEDISADSLSDAAIAAEDISADCDDSLLAEEEMSDSVSLALDDDESKLEVADETVTLKDANEGETSSEPAVTVGASTNKAAKKSVKIVAPSATKNFKKSQKFKVTIKSQADSTPIAGAKVTLKVYTGKKYKTYNLKTNSKGEVSINTKSLSLGKHKVVIKVKGTSAITAKSAKSSIRIVKSKLKIGVNYVTNIYKKSQKFDLVVKDKSSLKPVKGLKVTLKVYTGKKYKTYNLKTNSKGEVSINTKSLSLGTHKVVIKVKATSKYNAASEKASIKIIKNKVATHFKMENIDYKYAYNGVFEGVDMEVKLYDSSGNEVGFKDIHAQIKKSEDGSAYGDKYTFMSNTGWHEVLCRQTGYPCYLQVDFAGDDTYKPCTLKYAL